MSLLVLGMILSKYSWLNAVRHAFSDGYGKAIYKFGDEINGIIEWFSQLVGIYQRYFITQFLGDDFLKVGSV